MGYVDVPGIRNEAGDQVNPATEDTLLKRGNAFATLLNAQALPGQELRLDDAIGGDLYLGRNDDLAATADQTWEVVRVYRTATGLTTRIRYRTGVAWDAHTAGW